jgi:3-oxoacyl-[acyl-carrier protein] reductase
MIDFKDRKIIYTGAAGGLGLPTTLTFLDRGATVIVIDNNPKKIDSLMQAAKGKQGRLEILNVDLSKSSELQSALDGIIGKVGGVDTVINNAAVYPIKPFEEFTIDEFQLIERVNVESALICVQKTLPFMKEKKFGRIVNISSVAFGGGWKNLAPYVSSKGALVGLTRAWAREFGEFRITSNAIAPGAFPTDAEKIHPDQEGYVKYLIDHQAVKRRGEPRDVTNALLFFIARENSFVTGQTLHVDGGWIMN